MACVCRRRRSSVASCLACKTVQRNEQSDCGVCRKQCVQVLGCCWRRRARPRPRPRQEAEEPNEQLQEEEEKDGERPTAGGGIVLEEGQPPPTEPRLMRCRAVRRNWNLDDLCEEIGVS